MMYKPGLAAISLAALVAGYVPAVTAADIAEVPLTLSGCVVAGEEKDSFLLTNVVVDGTTFAPSDAFYRFDTTKGLKEHVGRRVEVKGKADLGDVDKGKVQVKSDDGTVTTEITSERRTVKVEGAHFGTLGAMKPGAGIATYKFEVEKVSPLAGNCASAETAR